MQLSALNVDWDYRLAKAMANKVAINDGKCTKVAPGTARKMV